MNFKAICAALTCSCSPVFASDLPPPKDLLTFVGHNEKIIQHKQADLDSNGLLDHVLVLEAASGENEGNRSLLVVTGEKNGELRLAKRSEKAVLCRSCGGVWSDPFDSIVASKSTFTVNHYGGSAWRWTTSYTFKYDEKLDSWLLFNVVETSFHAAEPEKAEKRILTPPKDYGQIDLVDFDPEQIARVNPE